MNTVERFWTKVDKTGSCWNWKGALWLGYGRFHFDYKSVQAYRYAYELTKGIIPEGLHIDHLCRNRACVNPDHLEAVTPGENVLRGTGVTAVNARATECKRGHQFTKESTYIVRGRYRCCNICVRIMRLARHARNGKW